MSDAELDHLYTALCHALGAADEAGMLQALGRFALLAMLEIDDVARIETLIQRAAREV